MRIQLLSDLHFEFHRDGGRELVASLDPTGVDVLVLAGDIAVGAGIAEAVALFCDRYRDATVVYVHGNHEYFGCGQASVRSLMGEVSAAYPRLRWLDACAAEIRGRRFLGAPLWFRPHPLTDRLKRSMADFSEIPGFEQWVHEENARALAFLERELGAGDIVVTHHLPSHRSVAARYSGSPLNAFFVCDVEDLVRERRPALWLHGHTHSSVRYRIGETTVACNPFGYAGYDLNAEFDAGLVLEV